MSRVLALVPDLLFGSKVKAMLEAAGHDVELAQSETDVWDQIAGSDVLVVDLTTDDVDGAFARSSERGAHTIVPPTDIPNVGRVAVLVDPTGAPFGLYATP